MNRKSCEGCKYYKSGDGFRAKGADRICHYMIETGVSRNCDPAVCDKKVIDAPYPKKAKNIQSQEFYYKGE